MILSAPSFVEQHKVERSRHMVYHVPQQQKTARESCVCDKLGRPSPVVVCQGRGNRSNDIPLPWLGELKKKKEKDVF